MFFYLQWFFVSFIHFFWALSMLSSFFKIFAVVFRHFDVLDQQWLFVLYIFNFVCLESSMLVWKQFPEWTFICDNLSFYWSIARHNDQFCELQTWSFSTNSKIIIFLMMMMNMIFSMKIMFFIYIYLKFIIILFIIFLIWTVHFFNDINCSSV